MRRRQPEIGQGRRSNDTLNTHAGPPLNFGRQAAAGQSTEDALGVFVLELAQRPAPQPYRVEIIPTQRAMIELMSAPQTSAVPVEAEGRYAECRLWLKWP